MKFIRKKKKHLEEAWQDIHNVNNDNSIGQLLHNFIFEYLSKNKFYVNITSTSTSSGEIQLPQDAVEAIIKYSSGHMIEYIIASNFKLKKIHVLDGTFTDKSYELPNFPEQLKNKFINLEIKAYNKISGFENLFTEMELNELEVRDDSYAVLCHYTIEKDPNPYYKIDKVYIMSSNNVKTKHDDYLKKKVEQEAKKKQNTKETQ